MDSSDGVGIHILNRSDVWVVCVLFSGSWELCRCVQGDAWISLKPVYKFGTSFINNNASLDAGITSEEYA